MLSTIFFVAGTLLLSLNFVRPFGLAISDWLYFAALGFAGFETFSVDRRNVICWVKNRFILPAGLILFGAIISTFNSRFFDLAVKEIIQQIYAITLFVSLIWVMVRRGKTDLIINAFILSGVFTAIIAVVDYTAGTRFGPTLSGTPDVQFWGRYAGSLGHPNKLGYFLVITVTLTLAKLIDVIPGRSKILLKLFWSLLIFFQLFGIYLSNSVTAFVGLALGFSVLILASTPLMQRIRNIAVPTAIASGLLLVIFVYSGTKQANFDDSFKSRTITDALNRVTTLTASSRIFVFNGALEQVIRDPLLGVGFDQVSTSGIALDLRELPGTIHNSLLQMWYVGGIFALFGWLVIYISLAKISFSLFQNTTKNNILPIGRGIAAAVLAILLMDQFQDAIYQREKWLAFGLLTGWFWMNTRKKICNSEGYKENNHNLVNPRYVNIVKG
jgi:O-antigen ligase